ncbi:MAG: autotransporter assembly complex family protein [Pseudomonadota bacterium]
MGRASLLAAVAVALPFTTWALTYEVTIEPVDDEQLQEALRVSSNLLQLEEDAEEEGVEPAVLIRQVDADRDRFGAALRSEGYYSGSVSVTVDGLSLDDESLLSRLQALPDDTEVPIVVTADPGPQYIVSSIDLVSNLETDAPMSPLVNMSILPLQPGDPARAADVLNTEAFIVNRVEMRGYPFAAVPQREAIVDLTEHTMALTFEGVSGPLATMGPVTFTGQERTNVEFLENRVPFQPGDPYRPENITDLRDRMTDLGVFSVVDVVPADELNEAGELPVTVEVQELPPRFVGFGASYATSQGFSANAYWGHRNLFGNAERLRISGEVGNILENSASDYSYNLGLSFTKPDFLRVDQNLNVSLQGLREVDNAYERRAVQGTVSVDRQITDQLTASLGVSVEQSEVIQDDEDNEFFLVSLPASLNWDTSDDLLNPTEGFRLGVSFRPFTSFLGSTSEFYRTRIDGSIYEDFNTDGEFILAARAAFGSVFGDSAGDIPANYLFYAGGGGSVRGYQYQGIGPRDEFGDPLGGRSLIEGSLELRWRFSEEFGVVPFVDFGQVYESSYPDFDEDFQVGAGIGLRYYTSFGPVRFDVAFPLNPMDGDGEDFAFYISLGQSF